MYEGKLSTPSGRPRQYSFTDYEEEFELNPIPLRSPPIPKLKYMIQSAPGTPLIGNLSSNQSYNRNHHSRQTASLRKNPYSTSQSVFDFNAASPTEIHLRSDFNSFKKKSATAYRHPSTTMSYASSSNRNHFSPEFLNASMSKVSSPNRLPPTKQAMQLQQRLQFCRDWMSNKDAEIASESYGKNPSTVLEALNKQMAAHQSIRQFHQSVFECGKLRKQLSDNERESFKAQVSQVELQFKQLHSNSSFRLANLKSLMKFLEGCSKELEWLKSNETQLSDYITSFDTLEFELQNLKTLQGELKVHFTAIDKLMLTATNLSNDNHPANTVIQLSANLLKGQWDRLNTLTSCLNLQITNIQKFAEFMREAKEVKEWAKKESGLLAQLEGRCADPKVQQSLQSVQRLIQERFQVLNELIFKYKSTPPLKLKNQHFPPNTKIQAISSYQLSEASIEEGNICVLLSDSLGKQWRVRSNNGVAMYPSCLFIVLPSYQPTNLQTKSGKHANSVEEIVEELRQSLSSLHAKVLDLGEEKVQLSRQNIVAHGRRVSSDEVQRLNEHCNALKAALRECAKSLNVLKFQNIPTDLKECKSFDSKLKEATREFMYVKENCLDLGEKFGGEASKNEHFRELLNEIENIQNTCSQLNERQEILTNLFASSKDLEGILSSNNSVNKQRLYAQLKTHESLLNSLQVTLHALYGDVPLANQYLQFAHRVLEGFKKKAKEPVMNTEKSSSENTVSSAFVQAPQAHNNSDFSMVSARTLRNQLEDGANQNREIRKYKGVYDGPIDEPMEEHMQSEDVEEMLQPLKDGEEKISKHSKQEFHSRRTNLGFESISKHEKNLTSVTSTKTTEFAGHFEFPISIEKAEQFGLLNTVNGVFTHPDSNETKTLKDAVMENYIEADSSTFLCPTNNRVFPLKDAFKNKLLTENGYFDSLDGSTCFKDLLNQNYIKISPDKKETFQKVEIDNRSEDSLSINSNDSGKVYAVVSVIDPLTKRNIDAFKAVQIGVLDQANATYNVHDPTGQLIQIPIENAIDLGFVIIDEHFVQSEYEESRLIHETKTYDIIGMIDPINKKEMSLNDAIKNNYIDQKKGTFYNVVTRKTMPIIEAIGLGYVIANLVSSEENADPYTKNKIMMQKEVSCVVKNIIDPQTGKQLSIHEAIQKGIFNPTKGEYTDLKSQKVLTLNEAIDMGYVLLEEGKLESEEITREEKVSSLHIDDEMEAREEMAREEITEETRTFQITGIKDVKNDVYLNFADAIYTGLIDEEKGLYFNNLTGQVLTVPEALQKGFIVGSTQTVDHHELFRSDIVARKKDEILSVFNPITRQEVSANEALQLGLISKDFKRYFNPATNQYITFDDALKKYLIKLKDTKRIKKSSTDETDLENDKISPETPVSIDWSGGRVLHKINKNIIPIKEALKYGLIDESVAAVLKLKHPEEYDEEKVEEKKIDDSVSLKMEIQMKLLRDSSGRIVIKDQSYLDRKNTNLHKKLKSSYGLSFYDALRLGLYSMQRGLYYDPHTKQRFSIFEAISSGLLNTKLPALVDITNGKVISLKDMIAEDYVDPKTGKIMVSKLSSSQLTLDPIYSGVHTPNMNLEDAIRCNLLNDETGLFTIPFVEKHIDLKTAIDMGYIAPKSSIVLNPVNGDRMFLDQALKDDIIDKKSGKFVDATAGKNISLSKAIIIGLIKHSYFDDCSFIMECVSGEVFSFEDALDKKILDFDYPTVYDVLLKKRVSFKIALSSGLIDKLKKRYINRLNGSEISLSKALKFGLIVLPGSPILSKPKKSSKDVVQTQFHTNVQLVKGAKLQEKITETFGSVPLPPLELYNKDEKNFKLLSDNPIIVNASKEQDNKKFIETKFYDTVTDDIPQKTTISNDGSVLTTKETVTKVNKAQIKETVENFDNFNNNFNHKRLQNVQSPQFSTNRAIQNNQQNSYHLTLKETAEPFEVEEIRPKEESSKKKFYSQNHNVHGVQNEFNNNNSHNMKEVIEPIVVEEIRSRVESTNTSGLSPSQNICRTVHPTYNSFNNSEQNENNFFENSTLERGLIKINWETGNIINISNKTLMNSQEAYDKGFIDLHIKDLIDNRGFNTSINPLNKLTLNEALKYKMIIIPINKIRDPSTNENITLATAIDTDLIDINRSVMIDPATHNHKPVKSLIDDGIFDVDNFMLKNKKNGKTLALEEIIFQAFLPEKGLPLPTEQYSQAEALERGLLNPSTNEFLEPITKIIISEKLAKEIGYIKEPFKSTTLINALKNGLLSHNTFIFTHPTTKENCNFDEALLKGYITVPNREEICEDIDGITLQSAFSRGYIDLEKSIFTDPITDAEIPFDTAIKKGWITLPIEESSSQLTRFLEFEDLPLNFGDAVLSGLYDENISLFINPYTGKHITLEEALKCNIVKSTSFVKSPATGQAYTVKNAINSGFLDFSSGRLIDLSVNKSLEMDEALYKNLILSSSPCVWIGIPFIDYLKTSGKVSVFDHLTEKYVSLQKALDLKLVDLNQDLYLNNKTGSRISLKEATQKRFVLIEKYNIQQDEMIDFKIIKALDTARNNWITPSNALRAGILNMDEKLYYDTKENEYCSLLEALNNGKILVESLEENETVNRGFYSIKKVFDALDNSWISPYESEKKGLIDMQYETYFNNLKNDKISFVNALKMGLIQVEEVNDINEIEREAIKSDDVSEVFDYTTGERFTLKEAIENNFIDKTGMYFIDPATKSHLTLYEAWQKGYIKLQNDENFALKSKVITSVLDPRTGEEIPISDAVTHQIVDKNNGTFWNMKTNTYMDLDFAISKGLVLVASADNASINSSRVEIGDSSESKAKVYVINAVRIPGSDEVLDPVEAERRGYINKVQGTYMYPITGERISIKDAISKNYVVASLVENPNYDTLKKNQAAYAVLESDKLFSEISSVVDLRNGEKVSVFEGIRRGLIDSEGTEYFNKTTGEKIPIDEAFKRKLVLGSVTNDTRSLNNRKLYFFKNPVLKDFPINKKQEMNKEYIDFQKPVNKEGCLSLKEASSQGLINHKNNIYHDTISGETFPLDEALQKGFLYVGNDDFKYDGTSLKTEKSTKIEVSNVSQNFNDDVNTELEFVPSSEPFVQNFDTIKQNYNLKSQNVQNESQEDTKAIKTDSLDRLLVDLEQETKAKKFSGIKIDSGIYSQPIKPKFVSPSDFNSSTSSQFQEKFNNNQDLDLSPVSFINESQQADMSFSEGQAFDNFILPSNQNSDNIHSSPPTRQKNALVSENEIYKTKVNGSNSFENTTYQDWTEILSEKTEENKLLINENSFEANQQNSIKSFDKTDASTITTRGSWGEQAFTMDQLLEYDYYDKESGMVLSQNKDYSVSLLEAIEKGWVCKDSVELYDPTNSKIIKLLDASSKGVIDLDNGNIIDSNKNVLLSFKDSINKALDLKLYDEVFPSDSVLIPSMSLCEAMKNNIFNPESKLFEFSDKNKLNLKKALDKKYLDSSRAMVKDPSTGQRVPFDLLVSLGLIDLENAVIKDSEGKNIPLHVAYSKNILFTSDIIQKPISLMKLFEDGYYHPEMNMFFDMESKKYIQLGEAIDKKILDSKSVLYYGLNSNEVLGLNDAFKSGLIDRNTGLTKNGLKLIDAYETNQIIIKPITIIKAIELNLLNETTGKFLDPSFRKFFTLEQCLKEGLIDPQSTIINPSTKKPILLSQGIQEGIIDGKAGTVTNISTEETLTLKEIYNASKFIKKNHGKTHETDSSFDETTQNENVKNEKINFETSLLTKESDFKLIYKPSLNIFVDPITEKTLTLEEAINDKYINPKQCLLLIPNEKHLIPLQKFIDDGLVDLKKGKVHSKQQNLDYLFHDLLHNKSLLKIVHDNYSLAEAIDLELFNPDTGIFIDPNTEEKLSLKSAFEKKLISPRKSLLILEMESLNLLEATKRGLVDEKTADVVIDNKKMSYIEALQDGIILDAYMPLKLSFEEALKANLFDKKNKSLIHPILKKNITLLEALESEVLESDKCFLYLPDSQIQVSLSEAASQNLLSKDLTTVKDPKRGKEFNVIIQLMQALHNPTKKSVSDNEASIINHEKSESVSHAVKLEGFDLQEIGPLNNRQLDVLREKLNLYKEWIGKVDDQISTYVVSDDEQHNAKQIKLIQDFLKTINEVKNALSVVHNSVDSISNGSQPTSPSSPLDRSSLEKLLIVNMEIKQEFSNLSKGCEAKLKSLSSCQDELMKFFNEKTKFEVWLKEAEITFEQNLNVLEDISGVYGQKEALKTFVDDVMIRHGDLRYVEICRSQFLDQAKHFQVLQMENKRMKRISSQLDLVNSTMEYFADLKEQYLELKKKSVNRLDILEAVGDCFKRYNDLKNKITLWSETSEVFLDNQEKLSNDGSNKINSSDLKQVSGLQTELIAQLRYLDKLESSSKDLIEWMNKLHFNKVETQPFVQTISDLKIRLNITEERFKKFLEQNIKVESGNNSLDRANIEQLSSWVGSVEKQLNQITEQKVNMKEATIINQLQEIKKLESEIHSQAPHLCHAVKDSEDEVSALKLEELEKKYAAMSDKVKQKEHELEKVIKVLGEFQEMVKKLKKWMNGALDCLDEKQGTLKLQETQKLNLEVFQKRDEFHESYRKLEASIKGFDSAGKEWVSETFQEMEISLNELEELCKNKTEEENRFSSLKEKFDFSKNKLVDWILENEELLEYLNSELNASAEESLLNEIHEKVDSVLALHQDERPTLEELNETGCLIDAKLTGPDHTTTLRRRLQRYLKKGLRSTSPLPLARTDDSEVTSEYQRVLKEINERFEYLEFNLNSLKESTKIKRNKFQTFHNNCENLLKWLTDTITVFKRKRFYSDDIDELEQENKKIEELKKDLIKKEIELNNLKSEHHTLYDKTNKKHEGLEKIKTKWDLICKLSTQWNTSLKQVVEEEKNFKDLYKHLQTWLKQKSKMIEACSAKFSSDPMVLEKQNLQLELLADEMKVEKKNYDKFIETGVKILERCEANSNEAFEVNNSLQESSSKWEKLEENLKTQKILLEKLRKQLTEFRELGEKLEFFGRECNNNYNNLSKLSSVKQKKLEEIDIRASEELKTFNNFVNAYLDLTSQINDVKITDELTNYRNKIENIYTDLLSKIEKEKNHFIEQKKETIKEVDEIRIASERLSNLEKELKNISSLPTNANDILTANQSLQNLKIKINKEISNFDSKSKKVSSENKKHLEAFDEKSIVVQTLLSKLEEKFSSAVDVSNVYISKLDLLKRWINEKKITKKPIGDKNDLEKTLKTLKLNESEIEGKYQEVLALKTTLGELCQITGGTAKSSVEDLDDLSDKLISFKDENGAQLKKLILLQSKLLNLEQTQNHLNGLIDEVKKAYETETVSKMKTNQLRENVSKLKTCFSSIENDEFVTKDLIENMKTEINSIEDSCRQAEELAAQREAKAKTVQHNAELIQEKLASIENTIISQKEFYESFLKEKKFKSIENNSKEIELLKRSFSGISEQIHETQEMLMKDQSNMKDDRKAFEMLGKLEKNNKKLQNTIENISKDIKDEKAEENKLINDLKSQSSQLGDVEAKLTTEIKVSSINTFLLDKELEEMKKVESCIKAHRSELNSLNIKLDSIHNKNDLISNKFSENDKNLTKLTSVLKNKIKKINELVDVLKLFDEKFNVINADFQKLEQDLERSRNMNSKEDYQSKMTTYQNLVEKLEDKENNLTVISSLKDSICSMVAISFKNTGLVEEIEANSMLLRNRFDEIMEELSLSLNQIELENVESFSNEKVAYKDQNVPIHQNMINQNRKMDLIDNVKETCQRMEKSPLKLSPKKIVVADKKQNTEDHYEKSYEDILENFDDLINNETLSDQVLDTSLIDDYDMEDPQEYLLTDAKDAQEDNIFSEMRIEFDKKMEDQNTKEQNKLKELRESLNETKRYLRNIEDFLETQDFSSYSSSNHVKELIIQYKNLIKDLEKRSKSLLLVESKLKQSSDVWTEHYDDTCRELDALNNVFSSAHLKYTQQTHTLEALLPLIEQFEGSSKDLVDWIKNTMDHLEMLSSTREISRHVLEDLKDLYTATKQKQYEVNCLEKVANRIDEELLMSLKKLKHNPMNGESFDGNKQSVKTFEVSSRVMKEEYVRLKEKLMEKLFGMERNVLIKTLKKDQKWKENPEKPALEAMAMDEVDELMMGTKSALDNYADEEALHTYDEIEELKNTLHKFITNDLIKAVEDHSENNMEITGKLKQLNEMKNLLDEHKIDGEERLIQVDQTNLMDMKIMINNLQNDLDHFFSGSFESNQIQNLKTSLNKLKLDYEKLQKKYEKIEKKSAQKKTYESKTNNSVDVELVKMSKTMNDIEVKIRNISEKVNVGNQKNQKFLLDLEETEFLLKNRENLLAKSLTTDDSDKFIETIRQIKKEMNHDKKEILDKKIKLSSKTKDFSRIITNESINKFHIVFNKMNFFQFILSNKMDAGFQTFGQNHDKITEMMAYDIKMLEEELDGLLEVDCISFNAVALSSFELDQIAKDFDSILNRITNFDNNSHLDGTPTFKENKIGKKVARKTKTTQKSLYPKFQSLLNDIKSKIDLKKEELHEALKLAVKTGKDIETLENETNALHAQAILYKGNDLVAPNVPIDVRTDVIKLLVPRYQDIDSKINNVSHIISDLIAKSPLKQRNVVKLFKKVETSDNESSEEKKNLSLKIEKLKKTSVSLRKFLMEWDSEINDISEMVERFNHVEENVLMKLSEVREKLDNYDENDVGDFETLEALTFLERDLIDIKKLITDEAQVTLNDLQPLLDESSNLKLEIKIHSLKENMKTIYKDFNALIEKSRDENDKIESLKSKLNNFNTKLDDLNELVVEITNTSKPIESLTLEELNVKHKSLKETEKNVDVTNGMYKKMTKQIQEYKKRKESNSFESGKSQEVEFLDNEEQNIKKKWNLLTDNLKMSKTMLGELIESLKEASDQYGNLNNWLSKNESELQEKTEMGDVDYISDQIEKTEAILNELTEQQKLIENKKKIIPSKDSVEKLVSRIENVRQLATDKKTELNKALKLATKFSSDAEELVELLNQVDVFMTESAATTESWDGSEICHALETLKTYSMKQLDKEEDFKKCLRDGKEWMEGSGEDTELKKWLKVFEERWLEVPNALENREKELESKLTQIKNVDKQVEDLVGWLDDTEERLVELEEIRVEENLPVVEQLFQDFELLEEEIQGKQDLMDQLVEIKSSQSSSGEVIQLREKWKRVWLMVMERRRRLQDVSDRLNEIEHMKNFNAEEWMERWMFSMNDNPSNVIAFFRKYDKNNSGMIKREDFVKAIINSEFPTSYLEVEAVADLFDYDDFINYKLFATSLKADEYLRDDATESDVISVEIVKQGRRCSCLNKFSIKMVEEGKYRFGDSQRLRLVRTQRNSVMVRVGGGWMSLEEFLLKNDPCRKNRTPELKERYPLAEGTNQSMAAFKPRYSQKSNPLKPQNILEVDKANKTPATQHHCGSVGSDQEVKQILSSSFRVIDELSSQDSRSNISGESESRTVRRQDPYKF